jgi:hypothetical protein
MPCRLQDRTGRPKRCNSKNFQDQNIVTNTGSADSYPWQHSESYSLEKGLYVAYVVADIIGFTDYEMFNINGCRETDGEGKAWVRTMPMTCCQVFINEDDMFEFIFWYPYKSNNWVRIYDMEDNLVAEMEVLLDDPHIVVDIPDGIYTVRTYWLNTDPIQEFIIGKP